MARTMNCPAWMGRASAVELQELPQKAWTTDGQRAHAVLSGDEDEESIEDSDDLALAVEICRNREQMALISAGFEEPHCHIEQRIFLYDDAGNKVASGQPDRVWIEGDRFFISDYKTGRKDAPAPALNPQLIMYAVLVAQEHGVTQGVLAIIPSWRPMPVVAEIGAEQIAQWRKAILVAIVEAGSPSPHATAGPWCDYCPFRPACPEAWAIVDQASKLNPKDPDMFENPSLLIERFRLAQHAKGTIKAYEEQIKARLAALPESIPGMHIGKGAELKTIPGSTPVYARLTSLYAPSVVLAAVKWTPAALAKSICPGKGQKAVQKTLEEELSDIIIKSNKSGSIEVD